MDNPDQVLGELLKTEQTCDSMLKLPTLEQSDDDDDELQQVKKNYEEMENKFKKLLEEQKQKLEQIEQKQKSQSAVDQGGISSLGLFKKEFKISGIITDTSSPDQLSFTGLIRQINTGISKGYKPEEICEGVIRSIQPGSLLRSYLETMSITDLTLPRLRKILRAHYKEKSSTELFQELSNLVQLPKEDTQSYLMRALNLRQKVLFASQELESALKYDPVLVQGVFLHVVENGLRNDNIRNKIRPVLSQANVQDEELMHQITTAITAEEERITKLSNASRSMSSKFSQVNAASQPSESANEKRVTKGKSKGNDQHTDKLLAAIESFQSVVTTLKKRIDSAEFSPIQDRSGYKSKQKPANKVPRAKVRGCPACTNNGQVDTCSHCYYCGSAKHFAAGCRQKVGKKRFTNLGNLPGLHPAGAGCSPYKSGQ